jgi:hypothetical protein
MRLRRTLAFFVFACCAVMIVVKDRPGQIFAEAHAADLSNAHGAARTGDWTIGKSEIDSKVEFSLIEHHEGGTSSHSSDWPASSFQGVDFSKPGRQDVRFTVTRDAGKIECEGFLQDGEGAGLFHFQPDTNYPREMQSLGFSVDEEKQFSMALQDVSLDFAKQMQNEHLTGLDTDKLIAFRIFRVDTAFIDQLRAEGLKISDSDKLVAFRIHGVTPQMVHSLHQAGYSPEEDTLIAMRIHGATPEWIDQLKQRGYDHVELENLIAFRIHGVSPEFISKLQGLGYSHPKPDDLIAMRIHNVTPEYISDLKARGLHDLTIDQLVNMRIHGID